ncbi:hypothetical protein B566_EDAN008192 [Ephemera danica]|nr:hypothetical protein B566_EDAN008192 [Ephemera danica]
MKVNPDLDNERKKCSFNVTELTHFLDGGIGKYRARKKREELFLSNPGFKDEIPIEYLSQENQYSESLKKARILMQIIKDQNQDYYYNERVGMPVDAAIMRKGIGNPFFVHLAVFPLTLYTNGQCHGVHTFMVQLRDEKTYQPLPGITLGDVGHKFGFNAGNNGFMALNKVRIPRNHMLMKNSQVLPLHAMTCCLKAICTSDASEAVERARLACGGHGYMTSSNLHPIFTLTAAAKTLEGENTVLLLQTARALIKTWLRVRQQKTISSLMNYLIAEKVTVKFNDLESIVQGFKQVAAAKVEQCGELLQRGTASGLAPEIAWNSVSVQLVEAAEAHCRAFLVERYVEALHTRMIELSPELRAVMQQLCKLYCVYWTLRKRGDFLQHTSMNINDVTALEDWQSRLLAQLRPNAVGLVDAFDFRDEILDSTLGAWDGQVYQRLFDSAMKSPLNAKPVHDSFHASIAPMLKAKY